MSSLLKIFHLSLSKQFMKFCVVGLLATLVNYLVFYLLFTYSGINYVLASSIGFVSGVFVGYPLNLAWSFADIKKHKNQSVILYGLVYFASFILNAVLIYTFVSILKIPVLISNFLCIAVTTITNFLGVRYLSFYTENSFIYRVKLLLGQLFRHPLFYVGLFIKAILVVWGSEYYYENAIKLVPEAFNSGDYYYLAFKQSIDFTHPLPLVYIVKLIGDVLFFIPYGVSYKLLILFSDLIILLIIFSWLRPYLKRILFLYWLSPVVLYGSYYLGYLDIVAIMFVFIALFLFLKEKVVLASIFFAIAVCIKIPVLLLFPFFIIYLIFTGIPYKKIILFPFIVLLTFILLNAPYITDYYFFSTVLLDQSKSLILYPVISYSQGLHIYIVPAVYVLLILLAYYLQIRSRELLLFFMGFVFEAILILIYPSPSWYIWFTPFLIYLYVNVAYKDKIFLLGFQIVFVIYFSVFPNNESSMILWDNIPFNKEKLQNLSFTVLQILFIMNILIVYKSGISKIVSKKLISKRFYLGIGGDSGSGKSTLSDLIKKLFNDKNTFIVHGDDSHRWERGNSKWQNFTHLDPKANDLSKEFSFLLSLEETNLIARKHYDHNTGKFVKRRINNISSRLIIYEGLHTFFLKRLRVFFDAKIFVHPDHDLQVHWKILRDSKKRGYTKEQVLEQVSKRTEDSDLYIKSQEKFADMIVSFKPTKPIENLGDENEKVDIYLELKVKNIVQLDSFLDEIVEKSKLDIESRYDENYHTISIKGDISSDDINDLANQLPLSVVGINNPNFASGYNGLLQIIILYYMLDLADVTK